MTDEFTIECEECGGEYPPDEEGPEHHDPACIIREARIQRGEWEPPEDVSER